MSRSSRHPPHQAQRPAGQAGNTFRSTDPRREYPHDACAREIREELGISVVVGDLLVVDWAPPAGQRPRAIVSFTFDCGSIANLDGLDLPRQELEDAAFFSPRTAEQRLPDNVTTRVRAAMSARDLRVPLYLAGGSDVPASSVDGAQHEAGPRPCGGRETPR
ncbi:NUDIX domain-containing protein [Micromonospora orduensis]|uniref:NUDIX domain-containing protein n=1 Tax=Micromonospora orduensis TaxID=1420891 RepID=UPI00142EE089|nr:NUDIX hydrolase [Micromonospora orduensis]